MRWINPLLPICCVIQQKRLYCKTTFSQLHTARWSRWIFSDPVCLLQGLWVTALGEKMAAVAKADWGVYFPKKWRNWGKIRGWIYTRLFSRSCLQLPPDWTTRALVVRGFQLSSASLWTNTNNWQITKGLKKGIQWRLSTIALTTKTKIHTILQLPPDK